MSTPFALLRSHVLDRPELLATLLSAETMDDFEAALRALRLGPELDVSREALEQAVRDARREHLERWLR
ncbi:MAG: hypothetical protein IPG17_07705 [Sandaracinaceae bacterium]|jgi:hypothetical protein|nr:hypothetical protein [Sandaracinaceae bacterium]MBK7152640.1 hypothetical protein [Sandaracinaceae bacterium]MBK7773866.1 hypothetical protein [Sandaracinaceae bacterium]MBK8412891.1 hypothetical protein [Sandaracinaceae bacterium]MBK8588113.1 hypothetical protein [Sandaracinaceae bacterium]